MVEVGVTQEFPAGRTRELARRRMEQAATASEAAAGDSRRAVQREVRRVWVELAYIEAARQQLASQSSWVDQMRAAARARYASGEGKQLEVLQAGLDVAMLKEQQLDLDRDAGDAAGAARALARRRRRGAGRAVHAAGADVPCRRLRNWRRDSRSTRRSRTTSCASRPRRPPYSSPSSPGGRAGCWT